MSTIDARIDEWLEAQLISAETAARLHDYEAGHPASTAGESPPGAAAPTAASAPAPARRPMALVGEILGYLGAILAITAIGFILFEVWSDLGTGGQIAIVTALAVVVGASAFFAARAPQDPAQRLASVLLLAEVLLLGWLTWVVTVHGVDLDEQDAMIWVFAVAAVVGAVIYLLRRRALAQLAILAALIGIVTTVVDRNWESLPESAPGIAIASVGAVWLALALARLLEPRAVGLVAGGLVTVFGLEITSFAYYEDPLWAYLAVVGAAAVLLVLAIMRERLTLLMIPGGIGLLVGVPQLAYEVVGDSLAVWIAVLLTGVGLVAVAVWMVRERTPRQAVGAPEREPADD